MTAIAQQKGLTIRDIRKPAHRSQLHFFSGKIEEVKSLKVAVLGTDSAMAPVANKLPATSTPMRNLFMKTPRESGSGNNGDADLRNGVES